MYEEQFDIVVVGARVAGSATARLLALGGLRVLVVDKASFPSDTVSTHGVGPIGGQLLQRWGLLDDVLATGVPREYSVALKMGDVDMEMQVPAGAFPPICPRRSVLDDILVQAARKAGAEVRERVICRELTVEDGVVVGLAYTDPQGGAHEVRSRLVIGADGASSFVAKAVQASWYNVLPSKVSFRYAYYSGIATRRVEMAWSHPDFAYIFPTNEGLACMAGATPDTHIGEFLMDGDGYLQALFEGACPRMADLLRNGERQTKFFTCRGKPGRFVVPYGTGWALVGDAAYFKDPVTGQGISDAFASAHLLADAVLDGFANPATMQECLAHYQRDRDELFTDAFAATQRLASLEWTNDELLNIRASYAPSPEKTAKLLGFAPVERVRA